MKRILALLLLTAFLLCGCTPYNEEETTTPQTEEGDPDKGDKPSDEAGEGDSPLGNLPFEGGYDPNGWT